MFGLGLIALASAASATPHGLPVRELLAAAETTCPTNPPVAVIANAARDAKLSARDTQTLFALCSIYHKGRADEARQALVRDYGVDPSRMQ